MSHYTEDEAKMKWCPHDFINRSNDNCIGSNCMAWRWVSYHRDQDMSNKTPQGYCGLAGVP